jgi:hypothetical protein
LELFGPSDNDLFHDSQHPSDEGNKRLAKRLTERLRPILAATEKPVN